MIRNRVIQFALILIAITLFVFTYYSNKKQNEIADSDQNEMIKTMEKNVETSEEISNVIEDVTYNGTDNRGTFFKLNAKVAEVYRDKPSLSNMKIVKALN